ncbi:DNA-dependent metalloprotease WSS1-like [Silene latifolia]|uniref:DNA-dependent metalloprotease WSS1-like n=1 Tax=Silene latifolia TaxID=37657 RepID=UPI003D77A309
MEEGDLNKVWEIKVLKKKPRHDEAQKILERVAKQVQPIMRKHNWHVKLLSEFYTKRMDLMGLNVGAGSEVKLSIRRPEDELEFYPYNEVVDIMLHELCHNAYSRHNASFYNLLDQLRQECEELIGMGIIGAGRRIGGDKSIMSALSPVEAAAMAAQRRFQDEIWCASAASNGGLNVETIAALDRESQSVPGSSSSSSRTSRKRRSNSSYGDGNFIDLTSDVEEIELSKRSRGNHISENKNDESVMWTCEKCTLLNPALALICEACETLKPKDDVTVKYKFWNCRFCTLQNSISLDKCEACDQWRYSRGPSFSALPPNLGT